MPAALAQLLPVACDTPATVAAADCDNPDLNASRKTPRADAGTDLLPCLRNPIEQHPQTNQVLQRPIESEPRFTTLGAV